MSYLADDFARNNSGKRARLACWFRSLAETIFSGERRLPACIRRQLADEIVFGKLPALPEEDCFGETPKPTRETRALPDRHVIALCVNVH